MARRTFSIGGVHPADSKISRDCKLEYLPIPPTVYIALSQHIGAPAKPVVAVGDKVKVGQVIAEPGAFMSAYIHSSVSGTVKSIGPRKDLSGNNQMVVEIAVEGDEWVDGIDRTDTLVTEIPDDPKGIIEKIKLGGVVGLGGATFPTHVKLSPPPGKTCEMLIINGCECEPYLTSDFRTLLEKGEQVVVGTAIIKKALGVAKATIAIEDNKPEAIKAMMEAVKGRDGVRVQPLKTKYPQGGEKQLIEAITGRQVPSGGLPIDAHVVVLNVGTCAAIADAIIDGKPLISRICTVTGCVRQPANLLLRIGTITEDIIGACGGYSETPGKVVFGGMMTGMCIPNDQMPIAKSTNGIVVLNEKQARSKDESPCIHCGRCVAACPIGLNPYQIKVAADKSDFAAAQKLHVMDCILCGSCAYECPSRRWLTPSFKFCKDHITAEAKAKAAAAAEKGGAKK